MSTILDLHDDCLIHIFKRLDGDAPPYHLMYVCQRFRYVLSEYWTELNEYVVDNFGHLMGTGEFPMRVIRKITLSKSKCSKIFLNKLRETHPEIEEAELYSFTDEDMAELLPLPNLKVLLCIGAHDMRGKRIKDCHKLTELHTYTGNVDPDEFLQTTFNNPLRVLIMPSETGIFVKKYAFEMVKNLQYLEELMIQYVHCKAFHLIGTLPLLKKLTIWDFEPHSCESCENLVLYKECSPNHDKMLFDELCKKNQLEELTTCHGYLAMYNLERISNLKSLRVLNLSETGVPFEVSLDIFKELVNLEEFSIDGCRRIIAEQSLEFIKNCEKLKLIYFWNADGINASFISKMNYIISQRKPAVVKPVTLGLGYLQPDVMKDLWIRAPVFHIRIVSLRKYYKFEKAYLHMEENRGKYNYNSMFMGKKFQIMKMMPKEMEFKMKIVAKGFNTVLKTNYKK